MLWSVCQLFDYSKGVCLGRCVELKRDTDKRQVLQTLMPQVILSLSHHLPGVDLSPSSIWLDGRLWLLLSMSIVGPLSFLRRLDSLRFTSQVALASVIYLVVVVVGWYFSGASTGRTRGDVVVATFSTATLSSFPVQVFAYTCAQNLFPVFNELKMNTQRRMNVVIGTSIGSAAVTYEVVSRMSPLRRRINSSDLPTPSPQLGIIGYLTFGSTVGSNVIAMYPFTSTFIAIGQLGIVLLVALSYPLQCHPCRACIHTLTTGWGKPQTHQAVPQDEDEVEDDDGIPADDHSSNASESMGTTKFVVVTCGIIVAGLIAAFVIHELELVSGRNVVASTPSANALPPLIL